MVSAAMGYGDMAFLWETIRESEQHHHILPSGSDCMALLGFKGSTHLYRHTSFILFCFIVLHRYCIFYKLKVSGKPPVSKSIGTICPQYLII